MTNAAAAPATSNVQTVTGTVHAGRAVGRHIVPVCMGGAKVAEGARGALTLSSPTDKPITCSRCKGTARTTRLTPEQRAERKAAVKVQRVAADAVLVERKRETIARRIERLDATRERFVAAGRESEPLFADLLADIASERAALAAL